MDFTPLIVSLPFVAVLVASGRWAHRRFVRFKQLPGHFDFRGRVTRLAPRLMMVWLLPVLFSVMLVFLALLAGAMAAMEGVEAPLASTLISAFTFLAAQALVLWLTDRWAKQQK